MTAALYNGQLRVLLDSWVDVASVQPASWYHVVVAKTQAEVRVYVNGARVYTGSQPNLGAQRTQIRIGAPTQELHDESGHSRCFGGAMAQVAIWRGAMDDAQVLASFDENKALFEPSTP